MNTAPEFWANAVRDELGCLAWMRTRTRKGYGRVTWDGRKQYAHRVAWTLTHLTRGRISRRCLACHRASQARLKASRSPG